LLNYQIYSKIKNINNMLTLYYIKIKNRKWKIS